ncbi:hypothetical protein ABIC76_005076 [Ralstonia sp. 1138]
MGISGDIVSNISGKAKPDQPPPAAEPVPDPANAASADVANNPPSLAQVDVESVMDQLIQESGRSLNWRTSIVDLMKALGIDRSLAHRKQLAQELSYQGDYRIPPA